MMGKCKLISQDIRKISSASIVCSCVQLSRRHFQNKIFFHYFWNFGNRNNFGNPLQERFRLTPPPTPKKKKKEKVASFHTVYTIVAFGSVVIDVIIFNELW